jgi:hypothetical protein
VPQQLRRRAKALAESLMPAIFSREKSLCKPSKPPLEVEK